jgi:hypothetical protein
MDLLDKRNLSLDEEDLVESKLMCIYYKKEIDVFITEYGTRKEIHFYYYNFIKFIKVKIYLIEDNYLSDKNLYFCVKNTDNIESIILLIKNKFYSNDSDIIL